MQRNKMLQKCRVKQAQWRDLRSIEGRYVMDSIEILISENPRFHSGNVSWSVHPEVLRFIRSCLKPSMRTLETGGGQSTVVFAIIGTHHTCITPIRHEAEQIHSYCRDHGINDNKITFIHDSSDVVLASGQGIPDVIDFLLIDGAHRFPFPILDWHFSEPKIPKDGIVAIDDYLTPSVRILHDFLLSEDDEWELIQSFHSILQRHWGTSFFRRKHEKHIHLDSIGRPSLYDYHLGQNMNRPRKHPLHFLLHHPRCTLRGLVDRIDNRRLFGKSIVDS
jgi:Methyltransferase domain